MCDLNEMAEAFSMSFDSADPIDRADYVIEAERANGVAAVLSTMRGAGQDDCDECGMDIPKERRKVAPWAIRCAPCQGVFEEKGKHRYG